MAKSLLKSLIALLKMSSEKGEERQQQNSVDYAEISLTAEEILLNLMQF